MFRTLPRWVKECALIWGTLGGLAVAVYLSGCDVWLARAVYAAEPGTTWQQVAWWLRQYGTWPGALAAVAGLVGLLWPGLWRRRPLVYQTSAVLVLTALLGAGLLNQVVVQELTDRHRPREWVLAAEPPKSGDFEGNSLPSGHAGIAFVLAAPWWVLRRQKPTVAKVFLAVGLAWGLVVGVGRMVLGAHFLSDVLVAGAISLSVAAMAAAGLRRWQSIPYKVIGLVVAVAAAAMVLGNHFVVNLRWEGSVQAIDLPCKLVAVQAEAGNAGAGVNIRLEGYGAPISNLQLIQSVDGVLRLQRGGVFHHLQCTGTWVQKAAE
jgi:membrane-associated PAP2 superfamily phosphatase